MNPFQIGRIGISSQQKARLNEMLSYFYDDARMGPALWEDAISVRDVDHKNTIILISWFELVFGNINYAMGEKMGILPVAFYEEWITDPSIHPIDIMYGHYQKTKAYGTAHTS